MHTDERSRPRAWAATAALIFGGVVVSFGAAEGADTRIGGVVGSKEKTVESLSLQVNALEMRIKKLEAGLIAVQRSVKKADTPDDDGSSDKSGKPGGDGGKNDNGGGQGPKDPGSSGSNQPGSASTQGDSSGTLHNVSSNTTIPTMTLRAPFVVVDSAGRTIFRVNDPTARGAGGERGVYIYGATGAPNIALTNVATGGKMFMMTDANSYSVSLGAVVDGAGIKIGANKKLRAFAGLDTRGNGLVSVYGPDGEKPLAGLQSSEQGKGLVAVFNEGKPVAFLTQSEAHPGGGNVTATDPGGAGVFSAGYDGDGGSACINGKQLRHCMGIGLPMAGGQ